jgi:hypothetical protein
VSPHDGPRKRGWGAATETGLKVLAASDQLAVCTTSSHTLRAVPCLAGGAGGGRARQAHARGQRYVWCSQRTRPAAWWGFLAQPTALARLVPVQQQRQRQHQPSRLSSSGGGSCMRCCRAWARVRTRRRRRRRRRRNTSFRQGVGPDPPEVGLSDMTAGAGPAAGAAGAAGVAGQVFCCCLRSGLALFSCCSDPCYGWLHASQAAHASSDGSASSRQQRHQPASGGTAAAPPTAAAAPTAAATAAAATGAHAAGCWVEWALFTAHGYEAMFDPAAHMTCARCKGWHA